MSMQGTVNPGQIYKFVAVYGRYLAITVQQSPEKYAYGPDKVHEIALKMGEAISQGKYSRSGAAFNATCRELGIPNNYQSVDAWVRRP